MAFFFVLAQLIVFHGVPSPLECVCLHLCVRACACLPVSVPVRVEPGQPCGARQAIGEEVLITPYETQHYSTEPHDRPGYRKHTV